MPSWYECCIVEEDQFAVSPITVLYNDDVVFFPEQLKPSKDTPADVGDAAVDCMNELTADDVMISSTVLDSCDDDSALDKFSDLATYILSDDMGPRRVQPLLPPASATSSSATDATSLPVLAVTSSVTKQSANHARRKAAVAKSSSAARDAKYLERRAKNNLASQLSRQKRKDHMMDMEKELSCLKQLNVRLQQRVIELETQLERWNWKDLSR